MAFPLPVVSPDPAATPTPAPPDGLVRRGRFDEGYAPGADGTPLYYRLDGESGPWVVFCNGLGVSTLFWDPLRDALKSAYRVVTWDYRSHGRSGPAPKRGFGIGTCADDLAKLLEFLGISRAVIVGHSMGSQVVLEGYRRFPDRFAALVPTLGGYGRTVETFFHTKLSVPALKVMKRVAMFHQPLSQAVVRGATSLPFAFDVARYAGLVNRDLCRRADMGPYLEHLARLDLNVYFQLADDLQAHDASDVLGTIRVPTLVFAGDRDVFTPVRVAEVMAKRIPGAELCVVRGGSHAAMIEQPELFALRLERFLTGRLGLPRFVQVR